MRRDRELIKASELREGDMVDLEGDFYADPNRDNPTFPFECETVFEVVRETPNCVCVYFDSTAVAFPVNHRLWRVVND